MVGQFDVTKKTADEDLTRFLRELAEEGCIKEEEGE